jgi:hypothetical protein
LPVLSAEAAKEIEEHQQKELQQVRVRWPAM